MDIKSLIGETLTHIDTNDCDQILLTTESGRKIMFYHSQSCCESVGIVDTQGNWHELLGKVIIDADEEIMGISENEYDSGTETKLIFKVNDATVISRWIGTSNGYSSESVDIADLTKKE